jgi:ATP-dependent Clp protease adapter protein ClpS
MAGWGVPDYETMSREELAEVVGSIFKKSANLTAEAAARIILQGIRDGSAIIRVGEGV